MATIQFSRKVGDGDPRPVLIRVITDDGRVLHFRADAGDFSQGLALHNPISVEAFEPVVEERPRAI